MANDGAHGDRPASDVRLGALIVGCVCLAYCALWWNRYLAPYAAGEAFFMVAPAHDWLPYRDYYYQAPPGTVFVNQWFGATFGHRLLYVWAYGVLANCAAAVVLYFALLRVCSPIGAAIGCIVSFIASCGDIGDTPPWYFHQFTAWQMPALLAFLISLERSQRTANAALCVISGFLAAWTIMLKQTAIPAALVFLLAPLVIGALRPELRRWSVLACASVALGMALVLVPVGTWLVRHDILGACLDQTLLHGPTSKGPILTSLLRPIVGLFDFRPHHVPVAFALLAIVPMFATIARARKGDADGARGNELPPARVLLGAVALVALVMILLGTNTLGPVNERTPSLALAAIASIGASSLAVWTTLRLRAHRDLRALTEWTISVVIAALTYGGTVSFAIGEVVAFPGLALVIAMFWGAAERRPATVKAVALSLTSVLVAISIAYLTWHKLRWPSEMFWWSEGKVADSKYAARAPQLQGFLMNKQTAAFYDDVTQLIADHVRPGDTIYTFPMYGIFYAIADTKSPTFCQTHWFDVCPDDITIADARVLVEQPPALIVAAELPEYAYPVHEALYRSGKKSGQRVLMSTLVRLVTERYELKASYKAPGYGMRIYAWVLKR